MLIRYNQIETVYYERVSSCSNGLQPRHLLQLFNLSNEDLLDEIFSLWLGK